MLSRAQYSRSSGVCSSQIGFSEASQSLIPDGSILPEGHRSPDPNTPRVLEKKPDPSRSSGRLRACVTISRSPALPQASPGRVWSQFGGTLRDRRIVRRLGLARIETCCAAPCRCIRQRSPDCSCERQFGPLKLRPAQAALGTIASKSSRHTKRLTAITIG